MGSTACTEPQCLYSRAIPLLPLWAVRPVQSLSACTEPQCLYSTAIPLLPLWAVRPVQSLSACTVQLYLYSPYGPYGLYRASVTVQGRTLHLLPLIVGQYSPSCNLVFSSRPFFHFPVSSFTQLKIFTAWLGKWEYYHCIVFAHPSRGFFLCHIAVIVLKFVERILCMFFVINDSSLNDHLCYYWFRNCSQDRSDASLRAFRLKKI